MTMQTDCGCGAGGESGLWGIYLYDILLATELLVLLLKMTALICTTINSRRVDYLPHCQHTVYYHT